MSALNVDWKRREKQVRAAVEGLGFVGLKAGRLARFANELLEAELKDDALRIAEEAFLMSTSADGVIEGMLDEAEVTYHVLCDVHDAHGDLSRLKEAEETWMLSFFTEPPVRLYGVLFSNDGAAPKAVLHPWMAQADGLISGEGSPES